MELVLVGHAEPSEDARGRCYGRLDVGLSDSGWDQCGRLAAHLAGGSLAAIVCSPLLERATPQVRSRSHTGSR